MMIWTAHPTKKKAALVLAVLALTAGALFFLRKPPAQPAAETVLTTNEERIAYLESLGWEVNPEPLETLQFLLPETLEAPYDAYNELQKTQGFDLSLCCGKQVARYTYTVLNYPGRSEGVQVNLYLCEEVPVAGDIFCAGSDGFQEILAYPESDA